jgi:hypothetical protein
MLAAIYNQIIAIIIIITVMPPIISDNIPPILRRLVLSEPCCDSTSVPGDGTKSIEEWIDYDTSVS